MGSTVSYAVDTVLQTDAANEARLWWTVISDGLIAQFVDQLQYLHFGLLSLCLVLAHFLFHLFHQVPQHLVKLLFILAVHRANALKLFSQFRCLATEMHGNGVQLIALIKTAFG